MLLDEHGGGLRAAGDLKLLKDVGEITFDGLVAQAEGDGNFLVGLAVGHQGQDPSLLGRQHCILAIGVHRRKGSHTSEYRLSHGGIENGLPAGYGVNGLNQCRPPDRFQEIPFRTRKRGRQHRMLIRK